MKALVTGATGFIGSHLAEGLLREGIDVRALVRNPDRPGWLKGISEVEKATGRLEDIDSLKQALRGVDVVYHVAGIVKARSAKEYFRVNTLGTESMLQAFASHGGEGARFVFISSQAAVGPSPLDRALDESASARPITPYGMSKLEAEKRVLEWKDRIPVTVVRPPAVYGPRERDLYMYFKLATRGIIPVPGFGERKVSLAYVEDLVRGILLAGSSREALGKIFFIASGDYDWRELADALSTAIGRGRRIPIPVAVLFLGGLISEAASLVTRQAPALNRHKARELGQRAWLCSYRRARETLGYEPEWPIERGLKATATWYREAGWI